MKFLILVGKLTVKIIKYHYESVEAKKMLGLWNGYQTIHIFNQEHILLNNG